MQKAQKYAPTEDIRCLKEMLFKESDFFLAESSFRTKEQRKRFKNEVWDRLQKAEKEKEGMWKDFPFGDEKALKKHPQYQITEAFEFFLGWYLHKATIQEKLTFYQLILYDTSARGWIKQYLVNEHNTEFKE